jgi:hypothetical protein
MLNERASWALSKLLVKRNPEITKKMSTPMKPAWAHCGNRCTASSDSTATPRKPSMSKR